MIGSGILGYSPVITIPGMIPQITEVSISGAVYDTVRVDEEMTDTFDISEEWNSTTQLLAKFNGNLYAGNAELGIDNISDVIIKRRELGKFTWFNMFDIPIASVDDFNFTITDRYAKGGQIYQYAFVPIINGLEGEYSIAACAADGSRQIECVFDGVVVLDKDNMYHTILDVSAGTQKNQTKTYTSTLNCRYPVVVKNSVSNFYTGSISATYLHFIGGDYDKNGSRKYREEFLDFLVNNNTKMIKFHDGRAFLCEIVDQISDSNSSHPDAHTINYQFVEVGDVESNEDMYRAGLLDITEEWW